MFPKYMMATKAFHQLGEISSSEPDICVIHKEDADHYIGNWVTGLGFINVKFPKATTRELTPDEVKVFSGKRYGMYSLMSGELSYDLGHLNVE